MLSTLLYHQHAQNSYKKEEALVIIIILCNIPHILLFESFDLFLIKDVYDLSLNLLTLTDVLNHNIVPCTA